MEQICCCMSGCVRVGSKAPGYESTKRIESLISLLPCCGCFLTPSSAANVGKFFFFTLPFFDNVEAESDFFFFFVGHASFSIL